MFRMQEGGRIMYTLYIGGILVVALMPLLKLIKGSDSESHRRTFWSEAEKIDRDLEKARDNALFDGIYPL